MSKIIVKNIMISRINSRSALANELTKKIEQECPEGYRYKETIECNVRSSFDYEYSCESLVVYKKD